MIFPCPSTYQEDLDIPKSIFCRANGTAWPLELVSKMLDTHFPGCKMTPKGTQIKGTSQLLISFEVLFETEAQAIAFKKNPPIFLMDPPTIPPRKLSDDYTLYPTKHTTNQVLVKSDGTMSFSDEEFRKRRADIQHCINQHPHHIHNRYAIRHYPDESVRVLFANREDLEQFRAAFHANQARLVDLHSLHPNDKLNNAQDLFIQIQNPPRRQHQTFSDGEIDMIKLRLRNLIESVRVAVLADYRGNNEIRTDTDFVRSLTHHQTGTQTHPSHVIFCKFDQPTVWANMLVCLSLFHRFRSILFPSLQIAKTTAEKLSHKKEVIKKNRQKTILLFDVEVGQRVVTCEISVNGLDKKVVKTLVTKDASDRGKSQTQLRQSRDSRTTSPPITKPIPNSLNLVTGPTIMPNQHTAPSIYFQHRHIQEQAPNILSTGTTSSVSPPQTSFRSDAFIEQSFNPIHPYLLPPHHIPDRTQAASLPHSWQGTPSVNDLNDRSRIPGQTLLKANVSPFVPRSNPSSPPQRSSTDQTRQDQPQRENPPDSPLHLQCHLQNHDDTQSDSYVALDETSSNYFSITFDPNSEFLLSFMNDDSSYSNTTSPRGSSSDSDHPLRPQSAPGRVSSLVLSGAEGDQEEYVSPDLNPPRQGLYTDIELTNFIPPSPRPRPATNDESNMTACDTYDDPLDTWADHIAESTSDPQAETDFLLQNPLANDRTIESDRNSH
ncbi:hypothetical protein BLNAU_20650 [Blattamonas nauphoetae]|uniref:Uncharacterized protein n=1 Tax=Blattamonas nauphoetae TaxID=2049346 RepID=A0ABQ9WY56_9EUKA|nr:hypothetical protein BLNAU_20650 [Blattamonas nauphoetae]